MPKVSFMDVRIKGLEKMRLSIKYSPKDSHFYVDLPKEVYAATGIERERALTEKEVRQGVQETILKYEDSIGTKKKMIYVEWQHRGMHLDGRHDPYTHHNNDEENHTRGLTISWQVIFQVTHGEQHSYFDEDNRAIWRLDDEKILLEWTSERQEFFEKVTVAMEDLISKIHGFFGTGGELLQSKIDKRLELPFKKQD